jgi:hypothetical protein
MQLTFRPTFNRFMSSPSDVAFSDTSFDEAFSGASSNLASDRSFETEGSVMEVAGVAEEFSCKITHGRR